MFGKLVIHELTNPIRPYYKPVQFSMKGTWDIVFLVQRSSPFVSSHPEGAVLEGITHP
jgi:hypothetical protein